MNEFSNSGSESASGLPALVFRVGITGSRSLEMENLPKLKKEIHAVLVAIKEKIEDAMKSPFIRAAYDTKTSPVLRIISPLAEGSDRITAEVALSLGYELDVALPFTRDEYSKDFPESLEEFDRLMESAEGRILILDGARGRHENRSYEMVGHLVVRNCDLLLAIWDGMESRGRGGTADIVEYAARTGPPIWWISPEAAHPPIWVASAREFLHPHFASREEAATLSLRTYIHELLMPPQASHEHAHGVISGSVRWVREKISKNENSFLGFLNESGDSNGFIFKAHAWLIRRAAGRVQNLPVRPETVTPQKNELMSPFWRHRFVMADRMAVTYAERYRSSYVLVFGLAAAALGFAAVGVSTHLWYITLIEICLLGAIVTVVVSNEWGRWQDKLISYRLLAELCRKQQALSLVGWSLPAAEMAGNRQTAGVSQLGRDAWVGWYFNALLRSAPLLKIHFNPQTLRQVREELQVSLLDEQTKYHLLRDRTYKAAAAFFGGWGEKLFILTAVVASVEVFLLYSQTSWALTTAKILGVLTIFLPALSAAAVGIRSYAELELMGEQSTRMSAALDAAKIRLKTQPLDTPLASQEIGEEISNVTTSMLQDVFGWTQLYRVKIVEAG